MKKSTKWFDENRVCDLMKCRLDFFFLVLNNRLDFFFSFLDWRWASCWPTVSNTTRLNSTENRNELKEAHLLWLPFLTHCILWYDFVWILYIIYMRYIEKLFQIKRCVLSSLQSSNKNTNKTENKKNQLVHRE